MTDEMLHLSPQFLHATNAVPVTCQQDILVCTMWRKDSLFCLSTLSVSSIVKARSHFPQKNRSGRQSNATSLFSIRYPFVINLPQSAPPITAIRVNIPISSHHINRHRTPGAISRQVMLLQLCSVQLSALSLYPLTLWKGFKTYDDEKTASQSGHFASTAPSIYPSSSRNGGNMRSASWKFSIPGLSSRISAFISISPYRTGHDWVGARYHSSNAALRAIVTPLTRGESESVLGLCWSCHLRSR